MLQWLFARWRIRYSGGRLGREAFRTSVPAALRRQGEFVEVRKVRQIDIEASDDARLPEVITFDDALVEDIADGTVRPTIRKLWL
jgi:hypothetical protein